GFSISPAIPRRYGTIWRASRILTGWSALRYSISFPGPTTWSAARCWCAATEGQGFAEGDGSEGIVLLDPPRGLDHRLGVSGLHRPPLPVETPLVLGGQGLPGVEDGDMGGGLRHPEQHPVFDPKLGLLLQARGDGADPQAALGVGELVGEDGVGEQMDTAPQGQPLGGGYPQVDNPHPGAVPGLARGIHPLAKAVQAPVEEAGVGRQHRHHGHRPRHQPGHQGATSRSSPPSSASSRRAASRIPGGSALRARAPMRRRSSMRLTRLPLPSTRRLRVCCQASWLLSIMRPTSSRDSITSTNWSWRAPAWVAIFSALRFWSS